MNEINFLPQSYYRRRRRRRRIVLEALAIMALAGCLTAWFIAGAETLKELGAYAAEIEAEGTVAQNQLKELAALQAEHHDLAGQMRIHHQVALPVSFTNVLAAIAQATPESIAYSDLRLECRRPVPAPPARLETPHRKRGRAAPKPVAHDADAVRIELTGLSPDDRRIADLVGRLADHPLFKQVKLEFSRSTEQDSLIARRFRITMVVPLDRDYRDKREEVAHAD